MSNMIENGNYCVYVHTSPSCNGRRKIAGGFIWQYYEDAEKEVI